MTSQRKARKLTDEQVVEMRRQRRDGAKVRDLAAAFGVSVSVVSLACIGRTYRDAPGAIGRRGIDLAELRRIAPQGGPKAPVARRFGVDLSAVCGAIRRHGIKWGQQ